MSKNSCRFATSHTRKFAKEVFDGDLATAWAVIPDFMETNSIDDESAINPIQLKAYWDAQSNEEKKRIRLSVPEYQAIENDSDYNGTLGATIIGENVVLSTIKGAPTMFMSKYFAQHKELYNQPSILQKIVTPDDIIYYELAKVKYDLIYGDSLDDAAKIKMAISDLDSHHLDVDYPKRAINDTPYSIVPRFSDGRFASTNKDTGAISIKENISVEEFFNYILGNVNNATSEQKKKVLDEMAKYGVTEADLRKVVNNPYAVRQFILLHELDHKLHASDRAKYDTKNLMGKFQIDVELRANMYAWSQLTGSEMPTIIPQQPERAFEQHFIAMPTNNYADRTRENAQWSDVTLAFATDFNTAGERATAREARNKYIPSSIGYANDGSILNDEQLEANAIIESLKNQGLPLQNIKLNIAGNGIYSFPSNLSQEQLDYYIEAVIKELLNQGITISEIRSGGQTGIDEAGVKAAQKLGINWNVVTTKDFKFRGRDSKDVSDPMKFMSRFLQEGESISLEEVNNTQGPRTEGREFTGQMVEYYLGNKRDDVKATSTFGAIIEGKRTATTRWNHIDYWSKLKVGDIINWKSNKGDVIQVRVTKPATKLNVNTNPETWSKKEGWSTQKYMDDILPHVYKGEAYQIEFEFIKKVPKEKQGAGENVVNHKGKWTRDEVKNDTESLYIFTDNTDRNSGSNYISDNSWYAKKYGKGHHYPTMTAAVIRGLNNARPISTQRWYHDGAKGDTGRWNDSDIEEFKKVIDDEVNEIIKEWNTGKYKRVVFPGGDGLFYGQISQITKERTPKLFEYLSYKYGMLKNIINSGYEVKEDKKKGTVIPSRTETKTAQTPKIIDIWSSDNNGYERLSNFNNGPVTVDFNFLGGAIGNTFKTVEGAFQAQKLAYTDAYTEEEKNDLIKQFEKADGHTAQALGRSIKGLDTKAWDKDSEAILKYEMEEAFEQNQDARELLLSTGNAKLTHVKGSRGYAEKFPRILMEIRKEYQEATEAFEATLPSSRQESNQQIDPTMVETMPSKEEPKVQEIDYTLPKVGANMIKPDTTSPLYRMSLQMDVTQINNRVNMITHRITEGITNAISKKIRDLQVAINNGQATQEDIELWASLVDEEEGRKNGVPLVIDDVLKSVKQDIQEAYDFMQEATKEEIEEEYEVPNGDYARDQYKILLENYDDLFDMACDELENIENLRLSRHDGKVSSNKSNIEENREEGEFGDAEGGERATGNEGYSYSARMIDPHMSSRAATRRILSNLHQVNYKGEFETDDLGELVYVKEAVAYSSLINDMSKIVHHPTDFNIRHGDETYSYPALESLQGKYPWIKEILNKLHKDPNLGSALYTDLCKEYVSYWTQYDTTDEDGKIVRQTKRANEPVARQSIMSMVNATYMEHAVTIDDMLWDKEGNINEIGASNTKERANEVIESLKRGDTISDNVDTLADMLNAIGVNTNPEVLSRLLENNPQAEDQVTALATHISVIANGALKLDVNNSLVNEYKGAYESIADIIGTVSELANSITFRQGEADFPSYSTPNYIDFIKNGIKGEDWKQFLMEEYGYDDFLYDKKAQKFRPYWLDMLNTDKEVRDNFDIKFINVMDRKEYQDWTEEDIIKNYITEYNSVLINPNDDHQYAYYAFPIFSDSTIAAFIKAPRFIRNFEDEVTSRLVDLAKQELSRINKVEKRAVAKASKIQRFDATGNKFLFMPALNDVEIDGQPLVKYIKSLGTNIAEVNRVLDEAIRGIMSRDAEQFWENQKELYAREYTEKKVINEKKMKEVKKRLQQFYWNNALAQSQIIQLMTTDLAYYKDYTDFQKRFKEVYASGARLNTQSKYGRTIERTIYLSDKIITSPTYTGIMKSVKQAYKDKLITEDEMNSILDKFKNINAVDAQAYRTLSSYRAVMDMQGKWTTAMQAAFDRFSQGKWSKEDFNIVWGTIKPFVFANLKVNDGLGGYQRVPHQNKNSEFLLLAFLNNMYMGNMMKNSPQLTGLNRAMETFNIDVAMYESAVKAGGQGIIDISYSRDKLNKLKEGNIWESLMEDAKKELGEDFNKTSDYERFKAAYDYKLTNSSFSQEEYNKIMNDMLPSEQEVFDYIDEALHNEETANPTDLFEENPETKVRENKNVLHEIPYEHYMIAQPTSNHLVDSESVFGSQFRNLITSDMPDDFEITLGGKTYKAKNDEGKNEILELYQSLIVENLLDDWEKTADLFGDIKLLHKRLMQMVKGNPSYGPDILNALQLVEIDGKPQFNIPPHNTTVANKIEQLIFSVFKSNITKQYIKGVACVLVSNYGFDNDLYVLRDENGATIGFECLMPAHTKDLFEDYLIPVKDNKGKVIGQRIDENRVPKELLEGIGFRIPTESKYSISNLIIKGFLPQQNGAAIMMPAELTQLAGSDFDVDKLFIMLKESRTIINYDLKKAWDDFYTDPENADIKDDIDANFAALMLQYLNEEAANGTLESIEDLTDEEYREYEEAVRDWLKENNRKNYDLYSKGSSEAKKRFSKWFSRQVKQKDENGNPKYFKSRTLEVVQYDANKSPQQMSKAARNNMIVDLTRAIMSNPKTSYKMNNPGNYDNLGWEADRDVILRSPEYIDQWCQTIMGGERNSFTTQEIVKSILDAEGKKVSKFLKNFKKAPNPLSIETFAYYHNQNMTGGKLIGIYANNTTIQAKYQQSHLGASQKFQFFINGFKTGNLSAKYRTINGINTLISKNCAEFSAASVDNVKDPKLANLLQSTENAYITGTMLRMGLSIEEISLFFSLPFFSTKLESVLKGDKAALDLYNSTEPVEITSEELASVIIDSKADATKAKAVLAKILTVAESVKSLTTISRADSPNGAVSNTIEGAIKQVLNVDNFHNRERRIKVLTGLEGVIRNKIVGRNATKDQLREAIFNSDMPMLQAFYYLGIESAYNLASSQFKQINDTMISGIKSLNREFKYENLPEKIIGRYLKEAVAYGLSTSDLFKEDMSNQRAYFVNRFPDDFLKAKNNPKVSKYGMMKALTVNQYGDIVLENAPRLKGVRDMFSRDLCLMLFNEDPEISELAMNLFKYSYFKDGLGWRVDGFSPFFDTLFLSSIPSYIDTLRAMTFNGNDGMNWDNFHRQFIRNHATEMFVSIDDEYVEEIPDTVNILNERVQNPKNGNEPYTNILYNGELFERTYENVAPNEVQYARVKQVSTSYMGGITALYDANNTELDDIITKHEESLAGMPKRSDKQRAELIAKDQKNRKQKAKRASKKSDAELAEELEAKSGNMGTDFWDALEGGSNEEFINQTNTSQEQTEETQGVPQEYDGNNETKNVVCEF